MAFSDLLMAFCSLKSVFENALTGLVWESLAPRLQALDSCSHFTVHTVLISVVQGLKSPHGELTIKFVLYCIVLYCIVQTIMVFPFTKTSFRGETSGGVYCEQALCLGKGENESQEEGFVHPFLERACSQVSGMVASQKVGCFLRLQKFRLKIPAGGLSQTHEGEALTFLTLKKCYKKCS